MSKRSVEVDDEKIDTKKVKVWKDASELKDAEFASLPTIEQLTETKYSLDERPVPKVTPYEKPSVAKPKEDLYEKHIHLGETTPVTFPSKLGSGHIPVTYKGVQKVSIFAIKLMKDVENERKYIQSQIMLKSKLAVMLKSLPNANSDISMTERFVFNILLGLVIKFFSTNEIIKNESIFYTRQNNEKKQPSPSFVYALLSLQDNKNLNWFVEVRSKSAKGAYVYADWSILGYLLSLYMFSEKEKHAISTAMTPHHIKRWDLMTPISSGARISKILLQIYYLSGSNTHMTQGMSIRASIKAAIERRTNVTLPSSELHQLDIDPGVYVAHKEQIRQQNYLNQTNVLEFDLGTILDFRTKLVKSPYLMDKVLLVQLCTGSRFIEVIRVSNYFTMADALQKHIPLEVKVDIPEGDDEESEKIRNSMHVGGNLVVVGVAKSRHKLKESKNIEELELEDDDDRYQLELLNNLILPVKPVLFLSPAKIVYYVHKVIRPAIHRMLQANGESLNTMKLRDLSKLFNHLANKRLAEYPLTIDFKTVKTHWLRKLYANISYDNVGKHTNMTKTAWISMVLGHAPKSFTTALSYNTASIRPDLATSDQQDPQLIKEELQHMSNFYQEQTKRFWDVLKSKSLMIDLTHVDDNTNEVLHKLNNLKSINEQKMLTHTTLYAGGEAFKFKRVVKTQTRPEKVEYFKEVTKSMKEKKIALTYENYRRLGFANSFIRSQKLIK